MSSTKTLLSNKKLRQKLPRSASFRSTKMLSGDNWGGKKSKRRKNEPHRCRNSFKHPHKKLKRRAGFPREAANAVMGCLCCHTEVAKKIWHLSLRTEETCRGSQARNKLKTLIWTWYKAPQCPSFLESNRRNEECLTCPYRSKPNNRCSEDLHPDRP